MIDAKVFPEKTSNPDIVLVSPVCGGSKHWAGYYQNPGKCVCGKQEWEFVEVTDTDYPNWWHPGWVCNNCEQWIYAFKATVNGATEEEMTQVYNNIQKMNFLQVKQTGEWVDDMMDVLDEVMDNEE